MRGSLMAHNVESAKSRRIRSPMSRRACRNRSSPMAVVGTGCTECHGRPCHCNSLSSRATASACSQNPASLTPSTAGSSRSPRSAPRRLSTRVIADVPLRCIPSTRMPMEWRSGASPGSALRDVPLAATGAGRDLPLGFDLERLIGSRPFGCSPQRSRIRIQPLGAAGARASAGSHHGPSTRREGCGAGPVGAGSGSSTIS